MRIFEREGYEFDGGEGCYLFDLGGRVSGQATSTGNTQAEVTFIPSVNVSNAPPLVSPYPAGLGLATLNTAYPASAVYGTATAPATATTSSLSLSTLLLLGGVAVGAWFLLRKGRR